MGFVAKSPNLEALAGYIYPHNGLLIFQRRPFPPGGGGTGERARQPSVLEVLAWKSETSLVYVLPDFREQPEIKIVHTSPY